MMTSWRLKDDVDDGLKRDLQMKEVNCEERIKIEWRVSLKLISMNIKRQISKRNQKLT